MQQRQVARSLDLASVVSQPSTVQESNTLYKSSRLALKQSLYCSRWFGLCGKGKKVEARSLGEAGERDWASSNRCFGAQLSVSLALGSSLPLSRLTASCRSCRWEAIAAGTVRRQSWKFCFLWDFVLRAPTTLAYLSVEYFDGWEVLLVVYRLHSWWTCWKTTFWISWISARLNGQLECSLVLLVSYLVDPASSHMLVSKIKPCMSKYKPH